MNSEAREELSAALEWALRYLENARDHRVLAQVRPDEIASSVGHEPPDEPESMDAIIEDLDRSILPGITHWNHPRFFGYFANTASLPGIAGELIASTMNANAMLWRTSPAATELEIVATRWMANLIGLPSWFGVINDTASTSSLHALVAARHAAAPEIRTSGLRGAPPMAVYASDQAHSSVDKAVLAIGLGTDSLRKVPTDSDFRMEPRELEAMMSKDASQGTRPMAVVATVGTTATTSVDPLPPLADSCQRYGAWLHVDAAYAGSAGAIPEYRWIWEGVERADSVVVNPHKWLFVPLDCSVLFLRNPEAMRVAFSVVPEYLRSTDDAPNLMDFGVSLGRRFRALKLWMVMKRMGARGIREAIAGHIRLAQELRSWVESSPDFELLAPALFSVVNFRYVPGDVDPSHLDEINASIANSVNASGKAFITTTAIAGRLALHVAIGNLWTEQGDVRLLWQLIRDAAASSYT